MPGGLGIRRGVFVLSVSYRWQIFSRWLLLSALAEGSHCWVTLSGPWIRWSFRCLNSNHVSNGNFIDRKTLLVFARNSANLESRFSFDFLSVQIMAFLSAVFYAGIAVLLVNVHTQARPVPPSAPVGCNIPGDKFYLPGEVIYKEGCSKIICKGNRIQVWNRDCRRSLAPHRKPLQDLRSPQRPKQYSK